ncbi:MAG: hypothetical protein H7249_09870 [Chitinophagaceae bacterium]|nr:hypothetical protein [Oligoflexus sp.]
MKITLALVSLLALSLAPHAHAAQSLSHPGELVLAPAVISTDMVNAAYALENITGAAETLATKYLRTSGIQGTAAASYLGDLLNDTTALKHSAVRLAILLDQDGSSAAIDAELDTLEIKYLAVNRESQKVSTQLYSQGKTLEGYQLRSAYTKIRSRYVYLQNLITQ